MQIDITKPIVLDYDPEKYTSFPDVILTPKGDLIAVYRRADAHHPTECEIVVACSKDKGKTWNKNILIESSLEKQGFVFNCPRINLVGQEILIVSDTKSSTKEGSCKWATYMWKSRDTKTWGVPVNLELSAMVPDKILKIGGNMFMGYHILEPIRGSKDRKRYVQMMAISRDNGATWRDRLTVAVSERCDFCEGSIVQVEGNQLYCFLRDNRSAVTRGFLTISTNCGLTWTEPAPLNTHMHRPVAGMKKHEPFAGAIIGTYRNTARRTIELFVQNRNSIRLKSFLVESEPSKHLYDFGYTGWVEFSDGSIGIIYYISGEKNPKICFVRVRLKS